MLFAFFDTKKSGEKGIRTPGPVARTTVFKTAAFDRSAISPFVNGHKSNIFFFTRKYFIKKILTYPKNIGLQLNLLI
jgi:hypothetical protein